MGAACIDEIEYDWQAEKLFRAEELVVLPNEPLRDVDAIRCASELLASAEFADEFPFMGRIVDMIAERAMPPVLFSFARCEHLLSGEDEVAHTFEAGGADADDCTSSGFAVCFQRRTTSLSTLLHEIAHIVDMGYDISRDGDSDGCLDRQAHGPVFAAILLRLIRIECGHIPWLRAKAAFWLSGVRCASADWHSRLAGGADVSAAGRSIATRIAEKRPHLQQHLRTESGLAKQRQRAGRSRMRTLRRQTTRQRHATEPHDARNPTRPRRMDASRLVRCTSMPPH